MHLNFIEIKVLNTCVALLKSGKKKLPASYGMVNTSVKRS